MFPYRLPAVVLGFLILAGCDTPSEQVTQKPDATEATATLQAETKQTTEPKAEKSDKVTVSSLSAAPKGKARLVVYRSSLWGLALQPKVFVDGRETGRCVPGSAFVVDLAPGEHNISATTEEEKNTIVNLSEGSVVYVSCSIGTGILIGRPVFERMPAQTAIKKSSHMGVKGFY